MSDEQAFRELFNYFYPRLLNYVYVIIRNHESAEDIVLEVLQSVWERRIKLVEIDRFENYLYVSAKNKTFDFHRINSRLQKVALNKPHFKEAITHQNPEKYLICKELLEKLDSSILELPDKSRLVYRLVKEDGLKYQEAADLLGISVKTVNNHLLSAMKSIRKSISKHLSEEKKNPILSSIKSFLF